MDMREFDQPIKTRRFVYHVSYWGFRKSISKYGLLLHGKYGRYDESAIFANNSPYPRYHWYPFVLDGWDWSVGEKFSFLNEESHDWFIRHASYYDFWQIDTKAIPNQWYRDDATDLDIAFPVVTFENIPPHALKLYKLQNDSINLVCTNGVISVNAIPEFVENKLWNEQYLK